MGVERNPLGPSTSPTTKFNPWGTVTEPLKLPVALNVAPAIINNMAKCTPIGAKRPASPLKAYKDGPFKNTCASQIMSNIRAKVKKNDNIQKIRVKRINV